MSQDLSPENEEFIRGQVKAGAYSTRDEAIDAGIELLRKRDTLVQRLQESRRQLDSGEFTNYDDDSLARRFDELKTIAGAPKKKGQ